MAGEEAVLNTTETTEVTETNEDSSTTDDSVVVDYSKVDFSDVDENGNIRNFKEAIVKPEKQENVENKDDKDDNVPETQENSLEIGSTENDDQEFSMDDFGSIEKHMNFLTQGFDDKPDIPKDKKTVEHDINDTIDKQTENTEKKIPYSEQFLNDLEPVKQIFANYLERHGVSWDVAKNDIDNHFQNLAFREELKHNNDREREEIRKEREFLKREQKVEASRPQYNQNIAEVSREKGWKNSKQLHDYMYDEKGGGELMWFLFNYKNENAQHLSSEDLKQNWNDFNIEFGSNKSNLEFAEKMMRKFFVANNYMKAVSKGVSKKLKQQKNINKGLSLNPKTNKSVTTKQTSKLSEAQRYFQR